MQPSGNVKVKMLEKTCFFFHMLFGSIYLAAGSIMLVCGIYFAIIPPRFQLFSNIAVGVLTLSVGLATIIIVSINYVMTWGKVQVLFYSSLAVCITNTINLTLLEFGEWYFLLSNDVIYAYANGGELKYEAVNAHYSTSVVSGISLLCSFIDVLLTYWEVFYLTRSPPEDPEERLPDEYFGTPNETDICTATTPASRYGPSWVFDNEVAAAEKTEPKVKFYIPNTLESIRDIYNEKRFPSAPVVKVQVDESSGQCGGDRHLTHMKTFSRTPSLADASGSSSTFSVPAIYDCLESLTQPNIYRSRLSSLKNLKGVPSPQVPKPKETNEDKTNYSSLVAELENSLSQKQEPKNEGYAIPCVGSTVGSKNVCKNSSVDKTDSKQQGSNDAEFSKELEAALKLIQDLESPSTVETLSESGKKAPEKNLKQKKSCDEKADSDLITLSGNSSLDDHGKSHKSLAVESQSTSGYNSPSLDRSSRFTPTVGASSTDLTVNPENDLSCVIRYLGNTAVVSLFSPSKPLPPTSSSEKVSVTNSNSNEMNRENVHRARTKSLVELTTKNLEKDERNTKAKIRRWKHFIERKRRPLLLPEVESAIIKSESLAFLSKSELKDRLNQTKNIHRQIEAKVHRQRSLRNADSFGSVEDLMDRHSVSPFL